MRLWWITDTKREKKKVCAYWTDRTEEHQGNLELQDMPHLLDAIYSKYRNKSSSFFYNGLCCIKSGRLLKTNPATGFDIKSGRRDKIC
jgi:hypothetical protein